MQADRKQALDRWSEALQQQTRETVEQMPVTTDGCLHFKHATLGYASIQLDDLYQGRLLLSTDTASSVHIFDDLEGLLQAGWVID